MTTDRTGSELVQGSEDNSSPQCPKCGSEMQLRTARRGPNAGNEFWGCSDYPTCRGTLDKNDDQGAGQSNARSIANSAAIGLDYHVPVFWSDRVGRRAWIAEYTSIGSLPGFVRQRIDNPNQDITRCLSETFFLSRKDRSRSGSEQATLIGGLFQKLLQRGLAPLPTIEVEREAIRSNGLSDSIKELPNSSPEIAFELKSNSRVDLQASTIMQAFIERADFRLDEEFDGDTSGESSLFDSDAEASFLSDWVSNTFGPAAAHWFVPQANLDRLLEANGVRTDGDRRIDFLFSFPGADPLAIEIDGEEHSEQVNIDRERDDALVGIGIKVVRVRNDEIWAGHGPGLAEIEQHCSRHLSDLSPLSENQTKVLKAIKDCSLASKLQLAIAKAIQFGWLEGQEVWSFHIDGADNIAAASVLDGIRILSALDRLYGTDVTPSHVEVTIGEETSVYSRTNEVGWGLDENAEEATEPNLRIRVETLASPYQAVEGESDPDCPDIIIRPAHLPISIAVESFFVIGRKKIEHKNATEIADILTVFLQQIFRKRKFRELQAEAIVNVLRQIDSIVLLPTGAGKSIIYQLAGLLTPGVTLVVDPIISLIEDQVEGLLQYGIDRAVAITSSTSTTAQRERLLTGVERGEYYFILHSPERLQSPVFRSTLRALAENSLVNLAVIDEAHCVSEWGHDFRPAYLNLGRNLRNFGKDRSGSPPPLLALTGTASRAVLRDVLAELDIDRMRAEAMIRPHSFDREELQFHISRTDPAQDVGAVLRGTLNALPRWFNVPREEFFRPAGRDTASGIVFVPVVNGRTHGVMSTLSEVRKTTGANCTYYSGGAPKGRESNWEVQKRENVRQFKSNSAPTLISTKAFGMGIDKPNIRYTIHLGMPGSLEAFYQEAGRAGRDRRVAHCAIVYSEYDQDRTDSLLDASCDLVEVRRRYQALPNKWANDDDVTRTFWFHLNAFSGQEVELEHVQHVLNEINSIDITDTIELPFWHGEGKSKAQEKAIFRLVKMGLLQDYEVNYGSKILRVYVAPFDLERCKAILLDYVQAAQPGRVKAFSRDLSRISEGDSKKCALKLAELLILFTYDVIERSRRRTIQEAVLLARSATDDKEIRRRLLDYLQEGMGAEAFDELLDQPDVTLAPWREILEKVYSPIEAGEVRGLAIRALESYPDHPGLLLIRAVSEMMTPDGDDAIATQALHAIFKSAQERYDLPDDDIVKMMDWLGDASASRISALALPFACSFHQAYEENLFDDTILGYGVSVLDGLENEDVDFAEHIFGLKRGSDNVARCSQSVIDVLASEEFTKSLEGKA
jgi:ATP-dependent DNA helicase RecQ